MEIKKTGFRSRIAIAGMAALCVPAFALVPPAQAEGDVPHHVYVAEMTNQGDLPDADTIADLVDTTLARWEDETDGRLSIARTGDVVRYEAQKSCDDLNALWEEAMDLTEFDGVDFDSDTNTHLVVVTSESCREHSQATHHPGSITLDRGGKVMFAYADDKGTHSLFHELGHNFGLYHANGDRCIGGDGCPKEYANHYSVMGVTHSDEVPYTHASLDTFERSRLNLTLPGEVETLVLDEGRQVRTFEYDLLGRGVGRGRRGLTITDPKDGTTYSIDFRSGTGHDADSFYGREIADPESGGYLYNRGVTVEHIYDSGTRSSLRYFTGSDGEKRYAMRAGESYDTDLTGDDKTLGMKIEVVRMDLTGSTDDIARVRVTLSDSSVPLKQQTGSLSVSGDARVGGTLTATVNGWTAGSTMSDVQWLDGGAPIAGATGSTYRIREGKQGHTLSARVTGTQEGYEPRTAQSNEVVVQQDAQPVDGAIYRIRSASSGSVLTAARHRWHHGYRQLTASAATGWRNQQWKARAAADGSFRFVNVATGRCLDNSGGRSTTGNPTIQYRCHAAATQRWRLVRSGAGYALVNVGSGKAIAPASSARCAWVVQAAGSYAWSFRKVG